MEEQEVLEIETLDEMTEILTNKFEKAAEDFIHIGYYLKKTRDRELYQQKGYTQSKQRHKSAWNRPTCWARVCAKRRECIVTPLGTENCGL